MRKNLRCSFVQPPLKRPVPLTVSRYLKQSNVLSLFGVLMATINGIVLQTIFINFIMKVFDLFVNIQAGIFLSFVLQILSPQIYLLNQSHFHLFLNVRKLPIFFFKLNSYAFSWAYLRTFCVKFLFSKLIWNCCWM